MSNFTKMILCVAAMPLMMFTGVGIHNWHKKYQVEHPAPPVEYYAQSVYDVEGNRIDVPHIKKDTLQSYYETGGECLLVGLPDEAFSIVKQGRNVYTFDMEVNKRVRHFIVYFSKTDHGYWVSSMTELVEPVEKKEVQEEKKMEIAPTVTHDAG